MKKTFLLSIYVCFTYSCFAQNIQVLDKTTLQPLPLVNIYSENQQISTVTDTKGQADFSQFKDLEKIIFQYTAYQTLELSFKEIEAMNFKILLSEKSYDLDEIVVSAGKFEEKRADVAQQIQVIKAKELAFMNQQSLADVMQQSGNVLVQKSQGGGGSPIIRGFEANKVLIVVDGVRMNNAIFRGGHLQNIITLDNSILDKMEVVFGPGSVVYGSDALGGVMHFHTKNPVFAREKPSLIKGQAFSRYSTAYNEKTGHLDLNFGFKKIAFLSSFTYSDFGDLMQGSVRNPFYGDWGKRLVYAERINGTDVLTLNDNSNLQKQSGYKQYDFLQKVLFQQSENISHTLNFQYSTSSDIPRYDRLTELAGNNLRFAQWYYGPQKRLFSSYSLNLKSSGILFNQARLVLAYQNIEESRHDRRFGNNNLNHRIEKVGVFTANADFNKNIASHEIRYGAEFTHNKVKSKANLENIATGEINPLNTRYPDGGADMQSFAVYLTHTWEISPRVIFTDGIRYSQINLNAKFIEKTFFPFSFDAVKQKSSAINGNLGLIYMPGADWRFAALGSSGFRAPNVDDLSKVFESAGGNLIVPNPDLNPEYTYNAEVSISKNIQKMVRFELTGFYTAYRDAITTQPFLFGGQSEILYNGVPSRVTANVNAGKAYIYGFNATLQADLTGAFSITSTLNYTYGRIKTDSTDYPLDHIAPVFGKTSFTLNIKQFKTELFALYNGWKRLKDYNVVGEDNLVYATSQGTPAWFTLNLRTAYQLNKYLQFQVALENILDQNYRVFASGISGAGRNLVLTVRGRF